MEFKNAVKNFDESIDCEINHKEHGWIPTTISAGDDLYGIYSEVSKNLELFIPDANYITTLKREMLESLSARSQGVVDTSSADYPDFEKLSFTKQETEARAYVASGGVSPTPLLDGIATARGVSLSNLVNKVIVKSDLFQSLVAAVAGTRQAIEVQVKNATTIEELQAIDVDPWAS